MSALEVARLPLDQHVIWTGHAYPALPDSRTSLCLGVVDRPWTPISLRRIYQDINARPGHRVPAEDLRSALRHHQRAPRAVLMLVRRTADGTYTAVHDLPDPAGSAPLRAGEPVGEASGNATMRALRAADRAVL